MLLRIVLIILIKKIISKMFYLIIDDVIKSSHKTAANNAKYFVLGLLKMSYIVYWFYQTYVLRIFYIINRYANTSRQYLINLDKDLISDII